MDVKSGSGLILGTIPAFHWSDQGDHEEVLHDCWDLSSRLPDKKHECTATFSTFYLQRVATHKNFHTNLYLKRDSNPWGQGSCEARTCTPTGQSSFLLCSIILHQNHKTFEHKMRKTDTDKGTSVRMCSLAERNYWLKYGHLTVTHKRDKHSIIKQLTVH